MPERAAPALACTSMTVRRPSPSPRRAYRQAELICRLSPARANSATRVNPTPSSTGPRKIPSRPKASAPPSTPSTVSRNGSLAPRAMNQGRMRLSAPEIDRPRRRSRGRCPAEMAGAHQPDARGDPDHRRADRQHGEEARDARPAAPAAARRTATSPNAVRMPCTSAVPRMPYTDAAHGRAGDLDQPLGLLARDPVQDQSAAGAIPARRRRRRRRR